MFRRASAPAQGARSKSTVFDQDAFPVVSGSSALVPQHRIEAPQDPLIQPDQVVERGRDTLLEVIHIEDELDLLGLRSKTVFVNSSGPISIDAVLLPPGQHLDFLGSLGREPLWSMADAAEVSEAVDGWVETLWKTLCDHQPASGSIVETWIGYYKPSTRSSYQLRVENELTEWTSFARFCSDFSSAINEKTAAR